MKSFQNKCFHVYRYTVNSHYNAVHYTLSTAHTTKIIRWKLRKLLEKLLGKFLVWEGSPIYNNITQYIPMISSAVVTTIVTITLLSKRGLLAPTPK